MVTSRGGTQPRALNAQRGGQGSGFGGSNSYARRSTEPTSSVGFGAGGGSSAAVSEPASGNMRSSLDKWREAKKARAAAARGELPGESSTASLFPNTITGQVRDNGDLELQRGDRIRHTDFGEGRVDDVTGVGTKRIAHVTFDQVGNKKLLIKIAPIEKLDDSETE